MASDLNPSMGLLQRYLGPTFMTKKRKNNIELPNQSGVKDRRLRTKFDEIQEGFSKAKSLLRRK